MRDIALTAVVGIALLLILKHPVMGAYLWAWLSLMNPHKMTYGFAFTMPFAQITAILTLVTLMFTKRRQALPMNGIVVLLILMLCWMSVTSLFAIAPEDQVRERWIFVIKIQVMMLVTMMLVCNPGQLRALIWVVVVSIGYFGVKGGVFTVLTGGGARVWGPPGGMLEENNALAGALTMLVPMMYFLRETESNRWVRHLLLFMMVTCFFSILGSQSRGALLSLVCMTLFLGLKSKHPVRSTVVLLGFVALAIAFMPESWSSRMDTIKTYEQDRSALSRIWTWHTLWNAAVDRPFVGAGFAADHPLVFQRYSPQDEIYAGFYGHVYVAHSIYFQMLGEHGFVGLSLFLALLVRTWLTANRVQRIAKADADLAGWAPMLMRMVQVSLVGYGVGGAFLSLAYLDVPYYYVSFVVLTDLIVRRKLESRRESGDSAVLPASGGGVAAHTRQPG
jgi:probable O-glycosylation ligase (exosortase A-associated)